MAAYSLRPVRTRSHGRPVLQNRLLMDPANRTGVCTHSRYFASCFLQDVNIRQLISVNSDATDVNTFVTLYWYYRPSNCEMLIESGYLSSSDFLIVQAAGMNTFTELYVSLNGVRFCLGLRDPVYSVVIQFIVSKPNSKTRQDRFFAGSCKRDVCVNVGAY